MNNTQVVETPDDRVRAYHEEKELESIASKLNIPSNDDEVRRTLRSLSLPAEYSNETRAERRRRLIKHLSDAHRFKKRTSNDEQINSTQSSQEAKVSSRGSAELLQARVIIEKSSLKHRRKFETIQTTADISGLQDLRFSLTSSQSGFQRPISAVSLLNEDTALIGDWSGTITVLGLGDSMPFLAQERHPSQVSCLSTQANTVLSGRLNGELSLYSYDHGELKTLNTLKVGNTRIAAAKFHPVNPLLVSTSDNCTWSLYDWRAGQKLLEQDGHKAAVTSLSMSPDGSLLLSGGSDVACIWDLRSGAVVGQYHGHADRITCSTWNQTTDNTNVEFITGGADDLCLVWDLRNSAEPRSTIYAHNSTPTQVDYSHDGKYLMTSSLDGFLKLWDCQDKFHLKRSLNIGAKITSFGSNTRDMKSPILVVGRWDRLVDIYRGSPSPL